MDMLHSLPNPLGMTHDKLVSLLLHEEYGTLPARPTRVTATQLERDKSFCAGRAELERWQLCCTAPWGEFTFPFYRVCPKGKTHPVPAFIHLNFSPNIPDRYQPTEEILDAGFALLTVYYKDVTSDDGDFATGLAGKVYQNGVRGPHQCGKIGLWAWALMALMDYAVTDTALNSARISVVGHSRLGKTALLAGALDPRFFCAISNDSGCSGASLSRGSTGETVAKICSKFPFWFCEHYLSYADREQLLPFDQHFLLAANAHHRVYVASAAADAWASPQNEYLAAVAASPYFEAAGKIGLSPCPSVPSGEAPPAPTALHEGCIGYHIRQGAHYLSREDWLQFIAYVRRHT